MGRMLDQQDGLFVYASNLLKNMIRIDNASRYVVMLRTAKHSAMFKDFPNAEVRVIPSRSKIWWDQVEVPLTARRYHADIIFNPKFSLPFFSRRPGVFVLHAGDWYVNPECYEWWDNLYIRFLLPMYCKKARRLLAISACIRDDMVLHAGADPRKISVTYAAPGPHFSPVSDPEGIKEFSIRYQLPESYIFAVTRAYHTGHNGLPEWPGGNIEGLVRGYRRYRTLGGTLALVVAGKDIDKYLLSNGFRSSDLEGIHFTGFIPYNVINLAYNLAEYFVLTTLYESFAFPLVEAMASGCPTIAPSTGACPEVAGDAAYFVDPRDPSAIGDAMWKLEKSPGLRERLRTSGLERVKTFTWERTAKLTVDAFDEITLGS